jgi:hypothetical protein
MATSPTTKVMFVDVTITLEDDWAKRSSEAAMMLDEVGLDVSNFNQHTGIVEGCIQADQLRKLERLDCVAYVRTGASYPKGNPS